MTDIPTRIAVAEAEAIIDRVAAQHRLGSESVTLARAHGRVLAEPVIAGLALPPFDNSAMDGFALRHADLGDGETVLTLAGERFAGVVDAEASIQAGQCIRITTGAPVPRGADTVVIKEHARVEGDRVQVLQVPLLGANIRRAGEDVQPRDAVLAAGSRLTPARIGLAAALGLPALPVRIRPTVAVFTTGDELIEPGLPLPPGGIYNSNREQLLGWLRTQGLEPVAWPNLPDDAERTAAVLRDAADSFDVVITCGAVSAGEKDHIPAILQRHGRLHFWKVRMKPGMPVLLATLGRACVLGLPGNPVSVLATAATLGRRLLDGLQDCREAEAIFTARLATPWHKRHERLEFLRGRLQCDAQGVLHVQPDPADGSHRMRAAADSNALIVLDEGPRDYPAGTPVRVLRL